MPPIQSMFLQNLFRGAPGICAVASIQTWGLVCAFRNLLGGSAGDVNAGKYFLESHGHKTEVPAMTWKIICVLDVVSVMAWFILGGCIICGVLANHHKWIWFENSTDYSMVVGETAIFMVVAIVLSSFLLPSAV